MKKKKITKKVKRQKKKPVPSNEGRSLWSPAAVKESTPLDKVDVSKIKITKEDVERIKREVKEFSENSVFNTKKRPKMDDKALELHACVVCKGALKAQSRWFQTGPLVMGGHNSGYYVTTWHCPTCYLIYDFSKKGL